MPHLHTGHHPKPAMLTRTDTNVEVSKKVNKQSILSKRVPLDFYTPQALVVIYYRHKPILTKLINHVKKLRKYTP